MFVYYCTHVCVKCVHLCVIVRVHVRGGQLSSKHFRTSGLWLLIDIVVSRHPNIPVFPPDLLRPQEQ